VIPWDELVVPLVGVAVSVLSGIAYAVWRGHRARRSLPAVRAGRAVTIPVMVGRGEDSVSGRAFRDGDDVRVVTAKFQVRLGRDDFARSAVRRARLDEEHFAYAVQRGFVDEDGTAYLVGPLEEWEPAFEALLDAPPRPAGRLRPLMAGLPRGAAAGVVAGLLGLLLFQGIWAMGHDVQARLERIVDDADGGTCAVTWTEGARHASAEVDCYEPYPAVGAPLRVRALGWPLTGKALDYEGTFEGITSIAGGIALLCLVGGAGVALRRLRRPEVRLLPRVNADPRFAPQVPTAVADAQRMTLRQLAGAVATQEGWVGDATDEPPPMRPWAPLLMALSAGRWWPTFVLLGAAWLPESLPRPLRLALTAGAAANLVWALVRALAAWLAIRRGARGSVTSEWDYQLVRSVDDGWLVLLLLGDTPHWAVLLGSEQHPAASGRCAVRGDLEEGGAIQLQVHGHFWVPASPVLRVTDEFLGELREDLEYRLVGEQDDEAEAPPTVRS
jgi:hypothetical protein